MFVMGKALCGFDYQHTCVRTHTHACMHRDRYTHTYT